MSFIAYLENHQPIATILTGVFAIIAVIVSQIWLDYRQRKDHRHAYELKENELLLTKKEDLMGAISQQILSISQVENIFDSWWRDFDKNYPHFQINPVLREIDTRLSKVHFLVKQFFPSFIGSIDKITDDSQRFHELCADFAMGASFGKEDFFKLDHIEIVEACNSYAVAYMQLSAFLVDRKEKGNLFSKKY